MSELCAICGERVGERVCPALGGKRICSVCCGKNRLKTLHCPPDCPYLLAAERNLRERRARELSKGWALLVSYLRQAGKGHLLPYLEVLREALARGLHELDATDTEVAAALDYCARKLSPIELLERPPSPLGKALEEAFLPLVRSGKLDGEVVREAMRTLAEFVEHFSRGDDERRFVRGLLGLYPPPPKEKPGLILRPGSPP
ncbi:MAG TPA: hypothetical protein ENF77_03705 [Candidatus Acetothermia bacterium]|nr:hypothetical protein [Candidatus Acetothermia bacterium]